MEDSSDDFAAEPGSPPRTEHEYLAHRIQQLQRAQRRWKVWILAAAPRLGR